MGQARARRGTHEQPSSPSALLAGFGFVASPITQFAAAGRRELSETITALTLIIRVRLMSSEREGHGAVRRELLRSLREQQ
jgi:hypothetical protein